MRIPFGPLHVDLISLETFRSQIKEKISQRSPSQIVTLNSLMYNLAKNDKELAAAISSSEFIVADSIGVALGVRFLSGKKINRLPGIDLINELCRVAAQNGYRLFLLGAREGIAQKAAEKLLSKYPGLIIAGTHHGYFKDLPIINIIKSARADILLVALAMPFQEEWIAANIKELGVPVVMGVGGSFDVLSGNLKRAPLWMQKAGLEWLFRLIQEPGRITRILDLPFFVLNMIQLKITK